MHSALYWLCMQDLCYLFFTHHGNSRMRPCSCSLSPVLLTLILPAEVWVLALLFVMIPAEHFHLLVSFYLKDLMIRLFGKLLNLLLLLCVLPKSVNHRHSTWRRLCHFGPLLLEQKCFVPVRYCVLLLSSRRVARRVLSVFLRAPYLLLRVSQLQWMKHRLWVLFYHHCGMRHQHQKKTETPKIHCHRQTSHHHCQQMLFADVVAVAIVALLALEDVRSVAHLAVLVIRLLLRVCLYVPLENPQIHFVLEILRRHPSLHEHHRHLRFEHQHSLFLRLRNFPHLRGVPSPPFVPLFVQLKIPFQALQVVIPAEVH
ncbi:hypothetical protein MOQ_006647 [Trypanosoma cruzi marinkellei]|uniref:Uncharacterized protein n=1 Tax=Trypanosoma cruzi marinkellei TaxID=85056 RepID=K2N4I5_TRYCR|nr:hypothetical protein MOQ_006647 [Trypanosoma cruzi marinkellei]